MPNPRFCRLLVPIVSLPLVACGGGASTPVNHPPSANVVASASVDAGTSVLLDASSSSDPDGDTLSYTWTLQSKPTGSTAVLTDGTGSHSSVFPDVAGDYVVALHVTDSKGASADTAKTVRAVVPVARFKAMANTACPTRLYLIDDRLVYASPDTSCIGSGGSALMDSVPEKLLCSNGGIRGPYCEDTGNMSLFLTVERGFATGSTVLGLDASHKVVRLN